MVRPATVRTRSSVMAIGTKSSSAERTVRLATSTISRRLPLSPPMVAMRVRPDGLPSNGPRSTFAPKRDSSATGSVTALGAGAGVARSAVQTPASTVREGSPGPVQKSLRPTSNPRVARTGARRVVRRRPDSTSRMRSWDPPSPITAETTRPPSAASPSSPAGRMLRAVVPSMPATATLRPSLPGVASIASAIQVLCRTSTGTPGRSAARALGIALGAWAEADGDKTTGGALAAGDSGDAVPTGGSAAADGLY